MTVCAVLVLRGVRGVTIMDHKGFLFLASVCFLVVGAACRGANAPGPQDDVVVQAPGVVAKSGDNGVSVKAPLGIEVKVDKDGVAVKAPAVDVKVDDKGVSVDAPLVTVRTGAETTK